MQKIYHIELDDLDFGQLLDGLEMRAESWKRTAEYLRTYIMPAGEFFIVEECTDADEADTIAAHYRAIISKIQEQREAQS